jgi:hypothetical protein
MYVDIPLTYSCKNDSNPLDTKFFNDSGDLSCITDCITDFEYLLNLYVKFIS